MRLVKGKAVSTLHYTLARYKHVDEKLLTDKMLTAAEGENFELALDYKNKLEMLSTFQGSRQRCFAPFAKDVILPPVLQA